jgi:pilus assembly protein Flp/PilA
MLKNTKVFFADDSGATAIEYALISALIAIALVTVLGQLGTKLSAEFSEVSSALK